MLQARLRQIIASRAGKHNSNIVGQSINVKTFVRRAHGANKRVKVLPIRRLPIKQQPWVQPTARQLPTDDILPLSVLRPASSSKAIAADPDTIQRFIQDYVVLGSRPVPEEVQRLHKKHDIQLEDLHMISLLLRRMDTQIATEISGRLMRTCSVLGVAKSTLFLISEALRRSSLGVPTIRAPLRHLSELAHQEGNVDAILMLGRVLEERADQKGAQLMYERVLKEGVEIEHSAAISGACVALGKMKLQQMSKEAAKDLFLKAALEFDDAEAYWQLTKVTEPNKQSYLIYLLKAASSGVPQAINEAARYYLRDTAMRNTSFAKEWSRLGASMGLGHSQLLLSLILKAENDDIEALRWLTLAEENPQVVRETKRIRMHWDNPSVNDELDRMIQQAG